jgi:serine/threonine protein phosphatase PrpC
VTVGWLGDSRAYWLPLSSDDSRALTTDDSWAADAVAAGLSAEAAEADPRSHSITRWLGTDAPECVPNIVHLELAGPGRLLLCSDGLWNYASAASAIAAAAPVDASAIEAARHLTDFARQAGGHDNITVVVIETKGSTGDDVHG